MDRVEGWKDVIEETEEKMKTMTEDQYDIKAMAQQVNTTVALRSVMISHTHDIYSGTLKLHVSINCVISDFFV